MASAQRDVHYELEWLRLDASVDGGGATPSPRGAASVVSYKNAVVVFGGWDMNSSFNDVWCFMTDVAGGAPGGEPPQPRGRWMCVPCVGVGVEPRCNHVAFIHGSHMVVHGGKDRNRYFEDLLLLDLDDVLAFVSSGGSRDRPAWHLQGCEGATPGTLAYHRAVVVAEYEAVIVAGGSSNDFQVNDLVWVLDLRRWRWTCAHMFDLADCEHVAWARPSCPCCAGCSRCSNQLCVSTGCCVAPSWHKNAGVELCDRFESTPAASPIISSQSLVLREGRSAARRDGCREFRLPSRCCPALALLPPLTFEGVVGSRRLALQGGDMFRFAPHIASCVFPSGVLELGGIDGLLEAATSDSRVTTPGVHGAPWHVYGDALPAIEHVGYAEDIEPRHLVQAGMPPSKWDGVVPLVPDTTDGQAAAPPCGSPSHVPALTPRTSHSWLLAPDGTLIVWGGWRLMDDVSYCPDAGAFNFSTKLWHRVAHCRDGHPMGVAFCSLCDAAAEFCASVAEWPHATVVFGGGVDHGSSSESLDESVPRYTNELFIVRAIPRSSMRFELAALVAAHL